MTLLHQKTTIQYQKFFWEKIKSLVFQKRFYFDPFLKVLKKVLRFKTIQIGVWRFYFWLCNAVLETLEQTPNLNTKGVQYNCWSLTIWYFISNQSNNTNDTDQPIFWNNITLWYDVCRLFNKLFFKIPAIICSFYLNIKHDKWFDNLLTMPL